MLACSYHVDSLLTMYELYRNMGENPYAEVCGERTSTHRCVGRKPVGRGVWG